MFGWHTLLATCAAQPQEVIHQSLKIPLVAPRHWLQATSAPPGNTNKPVANRNGFLLVLSQAGSSSWYEEQKPASS